MFPGGMGSMAPEMHYSHTFTVLENGCCRQGSGFSLEGGQARLLTSTATVY